MRSTFYEELIQRNDILAVARELGLEVRGNKCRCLRPEAHAHGDRTPSLSLFPRDNSFRCWVCQEVRGSVIDLVMQVRDVPLGEAVEYLARRAGMDPREAKPGSVVRERPAARPYGATPGASGRASAGGQPRPPVLPAPGPDAGLPLPAPASGTEAPAASAAGLAIEQHERSEVRRDHCIGQAAPGRAGGEPHALLGAAVERGAVRSSRLHRAAPFAALADDPDLPPVSDERAHAIFSEFLRWCDRPSDRNYLTTNRGISLATVDQMRVVWVGDPKGIEARLRDLFPPEELLGSGLFNEWGLIFRHYPVVFPFIRRGRVLFLQGRRVDGREPKYLSLRRPIPCLYNHDRLDSLPHGSPVVLCEGAVDTLTWLDHGVVAVGILGVGSFKPEWMEDLRPFRVLLGLDADAPGQRAARSLQQLFAGAGQEVTLVELPEGVKDVNQLFTERSLGQGDELTP